MFKMRSGTNNIKECTFIMYSFFFLNTFFHFCIVYDLTGD
jgi:hypothetical protein